MLKIAKEEEEWLYQTFDQAVQQEKQWAEYLFKDGSMIGLNEKLLCQYVEWIANRRMKAIGLKPFMISLLRITHYLGHNTGFLLRVCKLLPQETEVESYIVGGIKQDVKKDTFAGFEL